MNLHTKSDFTSLARRFLDPLLPLYSAGGALVHPGDTGATYPERTIGMEAFSRPLWALAPLWAGGGKAEEFLPLYQRGLANGSDPQSPEYWGDPKDYDQLFVEMAAIACAILETPENVWHPLTEPQKTNLARWLDTINHHELPGCNWLLFRVLVDLALDSVGRPYWGLKVFLLLALPDDHPFWSCDTAHLPRELTRPGVTPQPSADLLLQRLPDGQLNAYSPASYEKGDHGQFAEKYGKFVYNTRFGFSASRSYIQLEQTAPDSMLAFVIDGWTFVRRHSDKFVLLGDRLLSEWRPFPGIRVTTELIPTPWGHTRTHTVESSIACTAYDCGFAVPKFSHGFAAAEDGTQAEAHNDAARCVVRGTAGQGVIINAAPNTNLYDPNTVIPAVRYEIPVGMAVLNTQVESWYK